MEEKIWQTFTETLRSEPGGTSILASLVRCAPGKSTFIKRFMESLVLPNITEGYDRERARDEMPQSAAGKTVMTTEPKFIPDDAVPISLGEGARSAGKND